MIPTLYLLQDDDHVEGTWRVPPFFLHSKVIISCIMCGNPILVNGISANGIIKKLKCKGCGTEWPRVVLDGWGRESQKSEGQKVEGRGL